MDTVNQKAASANAIIKVAVLSVALNFAEDELADEAPWLKLPIISSLFHLVMNKVGQKIYKYLAQLATISVINIQTQKEQEAYLKAESALRAASSSGDADALTKATLDYESALADLVHFDGSASP